MKLDTQLTKLTKAESSIKARTVVLTPEFAAVALTNFNNSNRPMSLSLAKLYCNEMLRGKWMINGEPIIFSVDTEGNDHLISGQHRLMALTLLANAIENGNFPDAQTEIEAVVITGVAHDTADTVDTGKVRTHADVLFRDPWIDTIIPAAWNTTVNRRRMWTKTLAGAARLVWLQDGGELVSSAPKFLISEMMDFLQKRHPELGVFVTMVLEANDSKENTGLKISIPYIAALSYLASVDVFDNGDGTEIVAIDVLSEEKFNTFIRNIAVGAGMEKGSPEWALSGYWNKINGEAGSKDRDTEIIAPFIRAAKAMLEGKTGLKISDINLSAKEKLNHKDFPELFEGYHTLMFERAAAAKAAAAQAKLEKKEKIDVESDARADDEAADAPTLFTPEDDFSDVATPATPEPAAKPRRPSKSKAPAAVAAKRPSKKR